MALAFVAARKRASSDFEIIEDLGYLFPTVPDWAGLFDEARRRHGMTVVGPGGAR